MKFPAAFPHFSRNITAFKFLYFIKYPLWLFILALIPLNLFHSKIFGFKITDNLRYQLFYNPFSPKSHINIANYYLSENLINQAREEYLLAQEVSDQNPGHKTNVLGLSTSPITTWQKIITTYKTTEDNINSWKNINSLYPDYTYAYLKLAAFEIYMGKTDEAHRYINHVLKIDPANTLAQKLKALNKTP